MKTQSPFVGPDGIIELDPVTQVYVHGSLVVGPGHFEYNYPVGLDDPFHDAGRAKMGVFIIHLFDRLQDLANSLVVFHFTRMLLHQVIHDGIYVHCSVV